MCNKLNDNNIENITACSVPPKKRSVGDVVVYELSPLHHIVSVQLTGSVDIRHHVDTDKSEGGKLVLI